MFALLGFVRFIHRTATDLPEAEIVERIGDRVEDELKELGNQAENKRRSNAVSRWRRMARGRAPVTIAQSGRGYVQAIDYAGLINWCVDTDFCLQVRIRAGDFVVDGVCAFRVYGINRP